MNGELCWKDVWDTGISEIDSHHRQLAARLNRILEMLDAEADRTQGEALIEHLSELLKRTRQHFASEESMMRDVDYPEFAAHRREHKMLLAELSRFIREMERSKRVHHREMQQELKRWFVAHLVTDDMSFAKYYHAHALA